MIVKFTISDDCRVAVEPRFSEVHDAGDARVGESREVLRNFGANDASLRLMCYDGTSQSPASARCVTAMSA